MKFSDDPLSYVLNLRNEVIHIFGLPGTLKTSFLFYLTQTIIRITKDQKIFIIDLSHNFPISRMKVSSEDRQRIVIFRPKSIKDAILLIDDLEIYLENDSFLFIDDVFRFVQRSDSNYIKQTSLLLSLTRMLSLKLDFPIIMTNQARSFDQGTYSSFSTIINQYISYNLLFSRKKEGDILTVEALSDCTPKVSKNYDVGLEGVKFSLDFII